MEQQDYILAAAVYVELCIMYTKCNDVNEHGIKTAHRHYGGIPKMKKKHCGKMRKAFFRSQHIRLVYISTPSACKLVKNESLQQFTPPTWRPHLVSGMASARARVVDDDAL